MADWRRRALRIREAKQWAAHKRDTGMDVRALPPHKLFAADRGPIEKWERRPAHSVVAGNDSAASATRPRLPRGVRSDTIALPLAQMGIVVAGEERGEWCAGARNCAY